ILDRYPPCSRRPGRATRLCKQKERTGQLKFALRNGSGKAGLESGKVGVEMGDSLDAAEIVFEGNVLIGGVSVFVGQAETEQNAGHFESVVHLRHERNGAALANENRFLAEAFFQGRLGLLENGIVVGGDPGFAGAQNFKLAMNGFWKELSNVFLDEFSNFLRLLVGNQTRGEFCESLGRNYRLGAFPLVAAPDAVQFECWTRPKALDGGKTLFAEIAGSANGSLKILFLPRQSIQRLALGFRDVRDGIVEARDVDTEILVVKSCEKLCQDCEWIGDGAAIYTGMQI